MLQEAQVVYLSGGSLQTFTTNMMGLQDGYQMGSSKLRCPAFDHPSFVTNLIHFKQMIKLYTVLMWAASGAHLDAFI